MKKPICLILTALMAFVLLFSACAGTERETGTDPADESMTEETTSAEPDPTYPSVDVAQMPNPMAPADSPAAFAELGIAIDAPDGAENTSYYVISGQIAEVNFLLDGHGYSLRASKAEGDISGLYGELVSEQPLGDGATLTTLKSGDADWYCLRWMNGDVQVALSNTDGAEIEALQAIYNEVK